MHGALRFILAVLVMLSHLGHPGTLSVGVCSVVIFYMLSGYVVTRLIDKHFPMGRLLAFYAERFLRIYPLYLVFLIATASFVFATGFGPPTMTAGKAIQNLTIVPLNYYMFLDVSVVRGLCLLPLAWSLGVEIQSYSVLPFIIRSCAAKWIVALASLCLFSVAALGYLDSDTWGYRLLPSVIFIFLTGSAISKTVKTPKLADSFDRIFPQACWGYLLALLIALSVTYRLPHYPAAVMLGFIIGLPIMVYTSSSSIRIPFDSVFGRLSYGLFLIHLPVSWLFEYMFHRPAGGIGSLLWIVFVSIALSAMAAFTVERAVWSLRERITNS